MADPGSADARRIAGTGRLRETRLDARRCGGNSLAASGDGCCVTVKPRHRCDQRRDRRRVLTGKAEVTTEIAYGEAEENRIRADINHFRAGAERMQIRLPRGEAVEYDDDVGFRQPRPRIGPHMARMVRRDCEMRRPPGCDRDGPRLGPLRELSEARFVSGSALRYDERTLGGGEPRRRLREGFRVGRRHDRSHGGRRAQRAGGDWLAQSFAGQRKIDRPARRRHRDRVGAIEQARDLLWEP